MKWIPHPKQAIALKCPAFEVFFGGARGGGKTDWLLAEFTKNIHRGPAHKGIIFRRSYPELEEVIDRAKVMYSGMAGWAEARKTFTFESGATLKLRFAENFKDTSNYQGHAYTFMGFDELTNWPDDSVYTTLFACARSPQGLPVSIRATGNPGTVGHPWVQERFIDVAEPFDIYYDPESNESRCFIPSTLDDNPSLLENDPGYERRLKMVGGKRYNAWRYGDWTRVEGSALDAFDTNLHIVPPYTIDSGWKRVIGFDWGFSTPFSMGWYAIKPSGTLVRYKEFYGSFNKKNEGLRWSAKKVAEQAAERSAGDQAKIMFADPSCWQARGHGSEAGESVIQWFQFYDRGPRYSCRKANNDRKNGYLACYNILSARNEDGSPRFEVFETCKHFIRTIPKLVYDPNDPEDVDTRMEDHCVTGDTEVRTNNGVFPIKELVNTRGYIESINGFAPYYDCRMTRRDAEVIEVILSNGESITCTPDHRFLTKDLQWKPAESLLGVELYDTISYPKHRGKIWKQKLFRKLSRSAGGEGFINATDISSIEVRCFTGQFTKTRMVKFLRGIMSTIETEMRRIIHWITYSFLKLGNICLVTGKPETELLGRKQCEKERLPGIKVKKVRSFIGNTMRSIAEKLLQKRSTSYASIAGSIIKVNPRQSFAQTNANLLTGEPRDSTTKYAPVSNAEKHSPSISTQKQKPVRDHALIVVEIRPAGTEDVYNLEVEDTHCFIAGGAVIHNCYDEWRYVVMALRYLRTYVGAKRRSRKEQYDILRA